MNLKIGTRSSPLALAQVEEVKKELCQYFPELIFTLQPFMTMGDIDLSTSLKALEKSDFFTKEIDQALLSHQIDIAIHSAKDLPDPLPNGLSIYAITKGVDSRDSLVLHSPETLMSLKSCARIGCSSVRREKHLLELRPDLEMVDIRGTIHQRLKKWEDGDLDGVVIAEAALIRLNLTYLHREILSISTAPLQGKLAIVGRENNPIKQLFSVLSI